MIIDVNIIGGAKIMLELITSLIGGAIFLGLGIIGLSMIGACINTDLDIPLIVSRYEERF